jgi:1-acyl-sn-glycerol-3-phosphate acyltransferase
MQWLRSILFTIWAYGLVLVLGILFLPALLMPRGATLFGIRTWARMVRWGLRWIAGIKTELRGMENIPDGPVIYAPKHQSMYDVITPFLVFDAPALIMKRELLYYPIFGWFALKAEMIPIDRAGTVRTLKRMMAAAGERVEQGRPILIFPEGTRRLPGAPPIYKSGVFGIYRSLDIPIVPVATNSGLCWQRKGIFRRKGTIVFEALPAIETGLDRRVLLARLETSIEDGTDALLDEGLALQGRSRKDLPDHEPD